MQKTIVANFPAEYERATKESATRILTEVRQEAVTMGVECKTLHVTNFPTEAIVETAKASGCDLIVMGLHGRRGMARLLFGSQATRW